MRSRVFTLYKHTSPSGKVYIGITSQTNLNRRWDGGRGYKGNHYFYRAIQKYGWDAFRHDVLSVYQTRDEACAAEREMIAKYKSQDPAHGYNISPGGDHAEHTSDSKRKISQAQKGRRHSEATIRKISENRKGKGLRVIPEATKAKMRENHAGGAESKPVRCVETGAVYTCVNDASRATGIHKGPISRCCRRIPHYNTAGGYHWEWAGLSE